MLKVKDSLLLVVPFLFSSAWVSNFAAHVPGPFDEAMDRGGNMLKLKSLLVKEIFYFQRLFTCLLKEVFDFWPFEINMLFHLPFENNATSSSSSLVVFVFDCKKY